MKILLTKNVHCGKLTVYIYANRIFYTVRRG